MMTATRFLVLSFATASAIRTSQGCGTVPGSLIEVSASLVIGVCTDGVMRVVRTPPGHSAKEELMDRNSLMVAPGFPSSTPNFTVSAGKSGEITVSTSLMKAIVKNGLTSFFDIKTGDSLTSEIATTFTRTKDPAGNPSARTYVIEQSFTASEGEGFYGGGEFQNGLLGFRGTPIESERSHGSPRAAHAHQAVC